MNKTIQLVLVETKNPQNLGSILRLCTNFSITKVTLVRPITELSHPDCQAYATGTSYDLIHQVRVVQSLNEALSNSKLSIAFAGKIYSQHPPEAMNWFHLGQEIFQTNLTSSYDEVSLVFGNEKNGLSSDDILICERICQIPTSVELTSLNLSQAVGITLASLFHFQMDRKFPIQKKNTWANFQEKQNLYEHFWDLLVQLGFDVAGNPKRIGMIFKRFVERTQIKSNETRAFRAIIKRIIQRIENREI